jgi:hypothetical protein
MPRADAILNRFPRHELTIHRLLARDPDFQSVCADYDEALQALRHWAGFEAAGSPRISGYRELLTDLEAEIERLIAAEEHLDRRPNRRCQSPES